MSLYPHYLYLDRVIAPKQTHKIWVRELTKIIYPYATLSPDRAVWVRALAGDIVLCSWARHLTLTVPLSTQVYKWVPANLMLGGNPAMD